MTSCQILPASSSTRIVNPRFLSQTAVYTVQPDIARFVIDIDAHCEPSFLELTGIL